MPLRFKKCELHLPGLGRYRLGSGSEVRAASRPSPLQAAEETTRSSPPLALNCNEAPLTEPLPVTTAEVGSVPVTEPGLPAVAAAMTV